MRACVSGNGCVCVIRSGEGIKISSDEILAWRRDDAETARTVPS